jgi:large subunit ribosomal protein L24
MMHIKKNDTVEVIKGKDRDKRGVILEVLPKKNKVKVQGINLMIHHLKAKRQGETSTIKKQEAYISVSNVMPVCASCNKACRVNFIEIDNHKTRVCNKCKQAL